MCTNFDETQQVHELQEITPLRLYSDFIVVFIWYSISRNSHGECSNVYTLTSSLINYFRLVVSLFR